MASHLSATDKVVVQSIFKKYDLNNSNTMETSELESLLHDLGTDVSTNCIKALQLIIDKNEDGTITFEEFFSWWLRLGGKNEKDFFTKLQESEEKLEKAYLVFRQYDTNGSNNLSVDEFKKMYQEFYKLADVPTTQAEKVLKALDTDGNGSIGFVEFIKWLNWFTL